MLDYVNWGTVFSGAIALIALIMSTTLALNLRFGLWRDWSVRYSALLFICLILYSGAMLLEQTADGVPGSAARIVLEIGCFGDYLLSGMLAYAFTGFLLAITDPNARQSPLFLLLNVLGALHIVLIILGRIFHLFYYLDQANVYCRSSAYPFSLVVPGLMLLLGFWILLRCRKTVPRGGRLELAVRLKTAAPDAKLVFVTGYTDYALYAYQLHASGYLIKPVSVARIREELDHMCAPPLPLPKDGTLHVRCFGHFEVFWQGEPLSFQRHKAKELLAFLIDRRGAYCSSEEIIAGLWEEEGDLKDAKHRLRNLASALRQSLRAIGQESVLLHRRNQFAIVPERINSDYYRMLDGDMDAVNRFRGEYMAQYSWAELTKGDLYFRNSGLDLNK